MTKADEERVPLLMRMAAHPVRWALLTELAAGDRRVRELVAAVDEPQNLVSYHLRLLRSAGLVTTRRSNFDGRDSYYHLDLSRCGAAFTEAATALHPALVQQSAQSSDSSVLFLCTGNSSRSPMAEALLRHRIDGVHVMSAGSHPAQRFHPNAVKVLHEDFGIEIEPRKPQSLDVVSGQSFDLVITLCDKVREVPREHGSAVETHWSLPDPSGGAYPEFQRVAMEIDTRIGYLPL